MSASAANWDDFRLLLAIAESGTISGAATVLRISHPTLSRRLQRMEQRLGTRLVDRTPPVCRLTEAGEEMRAAANRLRDEIAQVETRIVGRDRNLAGPVRLTAPDAVAEYLLPKMLARLCADAPDLTVELSVSNQVVSLAQRVADIALRVTDTPDPGLKGRRLGTIDMAVYARDAGATAAFAGPWVGYDAALACTRPGAWVAAHVANDLVRFRANTLLGAAQAIRQGIGRGILPCFVAAALPDLVQVEPPIAELSSGLWLLVHPDLARTPRVRRAADALARMFKEAGPVLSGEPGAAP